MIKLASLITEITSDEELTASIIEYAKLSEEINSKMESIQQTMDAIKALEKQSTAQFKDIERYVVDFKKTKVVADKWVLEVKTELKYKRPTPQYKELWEDALAKLNPATRNVLEKLKEAHLDAKSKEVVDKISIDKVTEASFFDSAVNIFKSFLTKLIKFIMPFKQYKSVVTALPTVK